MILLEFWYPVSRCADLYVSKTWNYVYSKTRQKTNLDDKSLKAICGFLPKSSIYFFASAFSAPSSSWYKSRHLLKEDKQPQLQEASKIIFSASRDCHMSDSLFASLAKERFAFARFFKSVIDSKKVSSSWEEWKSDIAHHETGLLWSKAKRIVWENFSWRVDRSNEFWVK